jgi:signal transduction histidine kinase
MNTHCITDRNVRRGDPVAETTQDSGPGRLEPGHGGDGGPEGVLVPGGAVETYEERLHAVRSGLAAVSAAVHVLSTNAAVTGPTTRGQIGSLLIEELERLQRLVSSTDPIPVDELDSLDLDEVLESVTLTRHLVEHEVDWFPSGVQVLGSRDVVIELLNILLVNAERHAPGAPVRIEVELDGSMVKVSVIDSGPGVPDGLVPVLFERGSHREGSPGQGIGLGMARELATGLGGSLELDLTSRKGARFDLTLPTADLGGTA